MVIAILFILGLCFIGVTIYLIKDNKQINFPYYGMMKKKDDEEC